MKSALLDNQGRLPLNTSGIRNVFSFSKDQRFSATQQLQCRASYYDKNDLLTARTTSFGYGNRSKMAQNQQTPSPSEYNPRAQTKIKKGFTFSRHKKISFVDEHSKMLVSNPGPNKYQKTIFGKSYSFSFRSKYEDPFERQKSKLGPGQYNLSGLITQKGFYSESKYKSSGTRKIGKQRRFGSDETATPGPGKYKDQLGLDPIGNYYNSRIPSKGIRTFGRPNTLQLFRTNQTPGPGTYYDFPKYTVYSTPQP